MACSTMVASATVRVIGPAVSREVDRGKTPRLLTRPYVGLSPTIPQNAAGMRMEPPVSDPSEAAQRPAAVAVPEPPLEPPVMQSVFQGFRAGP